MSSLLLNLARHLSPPTLAALAARAFVRTTQQLEQACASPQEVQAQRLRRLLQREAQTEVGRRGDFQRIAGAADVHTAYAQALPIVQWNDVAQSIERMLAGERNVLVSEDPYFFATTSGTTGRRKLIPATSSFVDECKVTNRVLYRTMFTSLPGLLHGKRLAMRSPGIEDLPHGKKAGSITVALGGGVDDSAMDAVPGAVFAVPDFSTRYFLALRFALQERVTLCSAINPSTLQLFAHTLAAQAEPLCRALVDGTLGVDDERVGGAHVSLRQRARKDVAAAKRIEASIAKHGSARMADAFVHLVGLVCWKGGSAPWFLRKLKDSYGELPVLDYGYVASEGCFSAPLSLAGADGVLLPHAHVVELMPLSEHGNTNAKTIGLWEAEVGERYVPIVTTSAGLYRYDMNDVIEVTGRHGRAPLVTFLHKTGAVASITGEKLTEHHVVAAAATAGVLGAGFVAVPVYPRTGLPFWLLCIEENAVRPELANSFDAALSHANLEYDAKRVSQRLGPVQLGVLNNGAFVRHREQRVSAGAPDAHVKVPHLSADGELARTLGALRARPDLEGCLGTPPLE